MKLFESMKIGRMELKNRIVMPAMGTGYCNEMGFSTERLMAYLEERARGGAALITVQNTCIDSRGGKRLWRQLCIDSDKFIPGLYELTEAVHDWGAKIALQLIHSGRLADPDVNEGIQPVSASTMSGYSGITGKEVLARELRLDEIEALVEKFAQGVWRAKQAGFDAVEFHGAHGFLIAQFLSPFTNHRTDLYGGDLKGRMRFALEIVRRSKEKVGDDFPLIFRISADEYVPGGLILEETKEICRELEKTAVDALHISAGGGDESPWIKFGIMPGATPQGCLVHFAEEIKKIVKIPVITVGRINDPRFAEKILREGKADLVAMGRALLADPHLPQKAFMGNFNEIRRCIGCTLCSTFVLKKGMLRCTVNPSLGKEEEDRKIFPARGKKVLIIGGGPAGLEAAKWAAMKGHKVTLYEKEKKLGGQVKIAAKVPYKGEMISIIDHLSQQVRKMGIKVVLGEEVMVPLIKKASPEVIIIATGSVPLIPEIKGANQDTLTSVREILAGEKRVGKKVMIIGGSSAGLETAEFLADKGKEVVVIEEKEEVAQSMEPRGRFLLLQRLEKKGVKILKNAKVREWKAGKAILLIGKKEKEEEFETQFLVSALPPLPNQRLFNELRKIELNRGIDVYLIGDCLKPSSLYSAIHDGYRVGREI